MSLRIFLRDSKPLESIARRLEQPGAAKLQAKAWEAPVAKAPVFLSETPGSIRHRAPMLGEHTDEILTELGYRTDEIVALREKRVI